VPSRTAATFFLAAVLGIASGCASNQTIPMKVQSDPLGAYVLMKYKGEESADSDWIYLGNTPLTTQRRFHKDNLTDSQVLVLRLMKDGYLEQTREWHGRDLRDIEDEHGQLFWNPKLVPSSN